METTTRNALAAGTRAADAFGLRPAGTRALAVSRQHGPQELRRAALTLALALYPLVGSVTIVLAAIMLASGANAR